MYFLHVVNIRWFNAAAWYAFNLAKIQKLQGHNVIIATIKNSPVIKKAKQLDIETIVCDFNSNNPYRLSNSITCYLDIIKTYKPVIVHCHRGEFFFVPAIMRIFSKKPIVIRFRGDIRAPKKGVFNQMLYKKGCDFIITSGNFIKDYYIKYLGINSDKITTLYGGVDTSKFKRDVNKRKAERINLGYKNEHYVIAMVARFDPIKGHIYLIEAIRELYYRYNKVNIRLIIAGIDSSLNKNTIEEYVKKNNIADITTLVPYRSDIENIYNAADLIVVPSIGSEAICRVAMEAMACGTPVIGADTGVIPEILPSNNVFQKSNSKAIVDKVMTHSNVVQIFSLQDFYDSYMLIVEKLLSQ